MSKVRYQRPLNFEKSPESDGELRKRQEIEGLIEQSIDQHLALDVLVKLSVTPHGLVNDHLRRILWPQLAGVDVNSLELAPALDKLQLHPEYNQVVLDVNRSLKRFPPGIPYEQRIALQDQLTVMILRVIHKYPNLRYYQGYHDVAVTFLLVVGEEIAYAIMEHLSKTHFSECMQETMEATQRRLMFIWPVIKFENPELFKFLQRSTVGTLFALPWYLTWFGHSLNSYKAVVRLYDYFLASPIYTPIFVTAAILLYRSNEILKEDCDMASVHCLLSTLPEDLPFEELLKTSNQLMNKYSLTVVEQDVEKLIYQEKKQRTAEENMVIERRRKIPGPTTANQISSISQWLTNMFTSKSVIFTSAISIVVGVCAYYYKNQYLAAGIS
ncbi:TBC1 domain family member 20 isoform X1 [Drosophila subpulchrella]|uniref:TBC1 domain family member 20 isoform X1 n=1 Tax=Drosophila subpulchrella TaxID=1486046 RepID=UPI0018A15AA5|nr:TBC1 domain family member 20 isoform X1 [Drosophila subpulchrella]